MVGDGDIRGFFWLLRRIFRDEVLGGVRNGDDLVIDACRFCVDRGGVFMNNLSSTIVMP